MKRSLLVLASVVLVSSLVSADDLLGKGKGKGGGSQPAGQGRSGPGPSQGSGNGHGNGRGGNQPPSESPGRRGGGGGGQGSGSVKPDPQPKPVERGGGNPSPGLGRPEPQSKPAESPGRRGGGNPVSEQGKPDPKSKPAEIIGGRQGRNDDLSQKGNGRSGRPDYDGTSNQSSRRQLGNPIDIGAAPIDVRAGSLGNQVRREDKARPNYRNGYYQYDSGWNDNNFCYPYYNFNWNNNCVISPWYYYSNLPGYLNCGRTTIITVGFCNWGIGDSYSWRERNNSNWGNWDRDDRRSDLDEAIDDLVIAFEDQDRRALDRIIPTRGRINIYVDGTYCYSLDPDDFYDLMSDNIYGTRTTSYDVLSVRRYNDEAQVATRHSFRDAWGRRSTVYHHYRFVRGRSGYTISDFLTGNRRTGF